MSNDRRVDIPAALLPLAVAEVLEDTSALAGEASVVAEEIVRLRDMGSLSATLAGEIDWLIYQRWMHSAHVGEFRVTEPIKQLGDQLDRSRRGSLPDVQVDPVQVNARLADVVADRLPSTGA